VWGVPVVSVVTRAGSAPVVAAGPAALVVVSAVTVVAAGCSSGPAVSAVPVAPD
jgi:hypothetical protein